MRKEGDKVIKAKRAWEAITAVLIIKKDSNVQNVVLRILNTPKPHVMVVQFIIAGSGHTTLNFDPDGDWGTESRKSLEMLWMATQIQDEGCGI